MPVNPQSPKLGKSTALNMVQAIFTRLSTIVPSLTTQLSPTTVYQPGATIGGQLNAIDGTWGTWTAPDLTGTGASYYVQVECFGAGGGGGGGNSVTGGGGGGGGEYACEVQYPVKPGNIYSYTVGITGTGGMNTNTAQGPGIPGSQGTVSTATVFDTEGLGLAGGVVANPGQGGDLGNAGIGGKGGTGSTNSIHFDGGAGGTNQSGVGSDEPLFLAQNSGYFVHNGLDPSIIQAWYIMNDSDGTGRNDATGNGRTATWTNYTGHFGTTGTNDAPAQVPAYDQGTGFGPNDTATGWASEFYVGSTGAASARLQCPSFSHGGARTTISAWVQAPSAATWGRVGSGAYAVIAANCGFYYTSGGSVAGQALYFHNDGTTSNPNWQLYFYSGNGSMATTIHSAVTPTPGTWYYVVATFSSGTITLYVNGSQVATASTGFSSQPGGGSAMSIGLDPGGVVNWFFGLISNAWFALDAITSTGVSAAWGLTAPTGGAGGGASGGPSAKGGAGQSASTTFGGNGGTPATQPASLVNTTTQADGGYSGGNAGASDIAPPPPPGGGFGGGGGGGGNMASPPTLVVVTVPFISAATYNGTDAAVNPGGIYNVSQQANPSTLLNTVLYGGGQPSDTDTGSKNSLLLLPANIPQLYPAGTYTIWQAFLTVTNAFPNNTIEPILEVWGTADTSLPQTYLAPDALASLFGGPIPVGAGAVTFDISDTGICTELQVGSLTSLTIGPGPAPSFDAFNSPTGPEFYSAIYGPGAYDTEGNPLFPYLTLVMQKSVAPQVGSTGDPGAILITAINYENTPIATIQPFATTDAAGNQFAQGFTGTIAAFDPTINTPGSYKPETWKAASLVNSWANAGGTFAKAQYQLTANNQLHLIGNINNASASAAQFMTLPSQYRPLKDLDLPVSLHTTPAGGGTFLRTTAATGAVSIINGTTSSIASTQIGFDVIIPLDSSVQ